MKKKSKYLLTGLSLFCALSTTLNAATIKETTVNDDGYDTIDANDMILGITRFDSETVITGAKITKASTNDSKYYYKLNNSLDNYETPILYIYTGPIGGWYSLDDNNDVHAVEDTALLEKLENSNIYYVDNIEKQLEVELKDINVDDSTLPKGVTLKDGKLLVNATIDGFEVSTTDGQKVPYIKNEGKFILDQSKYYTVDQDGFITNYTGIKGKVEIPSKINDVNIVGIRSGAFDNKGVTEVVIPKSVKQIESNAFSNNELTSVIVNEKYDSGDFTSLANDAFGTFTNDKIKYNNDLTRYMSAFKDELTLKVQKDVDITGEEGKIALATFAFETEEERLDFTNRPDYIFGYMTYKDENTLILKIVRSDSMRKEVSKEIKYNVNKVDSDASDIDNIAKATKEYEEYYNNVKNNFKTDTSLELSTNDKIYEIYGKYDINSRVLDAGDGQEDIKDGINITEYEFRHVISSKTTQILYDVKSILNQSAVTYGFDLENTYDSEEEYHAAALKAFEDATNVKNYVVQDGSYQIYMKNNKKCTLIFVKDNRNNNMWYIEVRSSYDETSAYNIDSEGFITSYSGIGGSLIIPSKIGDTNIVGIRSNAFKENSGMTIDSVVIPKSIMTIESKAFSNYVRATIEGKYDKSDFTSLADDAFTEYSEIIYSNDLTKALDKFKDELTLNVQKDVDLTKELSHISLGNFAVINEVSRINDSNIAASFILTGEYGDGDGDGSQVEHTMYAKMEYKTDNTFNLTLTKTDESQKSVTKTVKYSINKVDGDANYIKSINKVVKANKDDVSNIKENFKENPSLKLPSSESITKLISDNNLKSMEIGYGVGEEIKLGNITLEQGSITNAIYSDDTLYDSYEFVTLWANYTFEDDSSKYSNEDEIYGHMVDEFKNKTGITNTTDIEYKYNYDSILDKTVGYHISLTDKDNGNNWSIEMTSNISDDFTYTHNYGSTIVTDYFPNLSAKDYNTTKEWMEAAIEKYKEKSGATEAKYSGFELVTDINGQEIKYTIDNNGNYNYIYRVEIQHTVGTSVTEYWYVYLYKTTKTKVETENYEATATDITAAINELATEKSLTNYKSSMTGEYYFKDSETGEFKRVNSNYNYIRQTIYDLDSDKIWYLFIKQTV